MSRTATPLCIDEQPGIGMSYVVRNVKTDENVRVSTTCQRDLDREGSTIKVLRSFSGEDPFFTAKIGSLHTSIVLLTFLCGPQHKKCMDSTGTYEWLGISTQEAKRDHMNMLEPGYVSQKDAMPAKPRNPVGLKKIRPTKVKPAKIPKQRGRPKGSKNKPKN